MIRGKSLILNKVVLDTGSAGTILNAIEIDGILGFDFIQSSKLVINSEQLLVYTTD
jgi:hypothetical protein